MLLSTLISPLIDGMYVSISILKAAGEAVSMAGNDNDNGRAAAEGTELMNNASPL